MQDSALSYSATAVVSATFTTPSLPHILVVLSERPAHAEEDWHSKSREYSISVCRGIGNALTKLSQQPFDLVIVVSDNDGSSGMEVIYQIAQLAPELPIILAVDDPEAQIASLAIESNVSDYTSTHYVSRSFDMVVQRNLARHRVQKRRMMTAQQHMKSTTENLLDAMLCALDYRDNETEGHSERVTAYALLMANVVGLSKRESLAVERGAMLHDIGKIGVPDRILHKPGRLTPEERAIMQQHPVLGFHMCAKIDALRAASRIVLHHHEHWDGHGYPDGLVGERIPIGARMFAVVDAYDAMTSKRIYREQISHDQACDELRRCSGTQFDPAAVEAFLQIPEQRLIQVREELSRTGSRLLWQTLPMTL
jgi:putative nucleotidyltransferase with HDIG domain